MDGLRADLPGVSVEPFDTHGVPAAAAEAMAFSLMGRNTLLGLINHLPRCTGAAHGRVLGVVSQGNQPTRLFG
jgi:anhydro-N-acetylmuramic acid kinase